jgi:DNA-binding CsgD family transcriptional regulator
MSEPLNCDIEMPGTRTGITVTPIKLPVYLTPPTTEVAIRVASDTDAARVTAVLEALGYSVTRDRPGPVQASQLETAADTLARRHKLTGREREILGIMLDGLDNAAIGARLKISRATVKWHVHNIFAKTNASNREGLLRAALQLPLPPFVTFATMAAACKLG